MAFWPYTWAVHQYSQGGIALYTYSYSLSTDMVAICLLCGTHVSEHAHKQQDSIITKGLIVCLNLSHSLVPRLPDLFNVTLKNWDGPGDEAIWATQRSLADLLSSLPKTIQNFNQVAQTWTARPFHYLWYYAIYRAKAIPIRSFVSRVG